MCRPINITPMLGNQFRNLLKTFVNIDENPRLSGGGGSLDVSDEACSHNALTFPFGVRFVTVVEFCREIPIAPSTFSLDMPVAAETACDVTSFTLRSRKTSYTGFRA